MQTRNYLKLSDGINRSNYNNAINPKNSSSIDFIKEITDIVNYKNALHEVIGEDLSLEKKLRQHQLRFEAIFQKSIFGNSIVTTDFMINEVNEAFKELLGFGEDELISRKITQFAHPDYLEDWKKLQMEVEGNNTPSYNMETLMVKKDGSAIWIQLAAIVFAEGLSNFCYIIFNDITESKSIKKEAQKLQQDQEMFSYMIAHDLRSPLNTMEALGALIKNNIEEGDHEEALFHLSLLEKTNRMSKAIINDLLLIGELENNAIEKKKVDVVTSFKSVIDQVSIGAKMKNVTINTEFLHSPVYVKGNKTKLERVFQNLLTNALKFSHTDSNIQVSVKKEVFSVFIKVSDNGIGIPLAMQPEVFTKFTSAKRRGTQGESTTGLGLFISKRIVDIHNGQIWFDSKQDEGTTFYLRLQLMDE